MRSFKDFLSLNEVFLNKAVRKNDLYPGLKRLWVSDKKEQKIGKLGAFDVYKKVSGKTIYFALADKEAGQWTEWPIIVQLSPLKKSSTRFTSYTVKLVGIHPAYAGQNIAPKFYHWLVTKGNISLVSGYEQSPGGKSIWVRLSKMPGVFVFGWDDKRMKAFDVEPGTLSAKIEIYNDDIEREMKDIDKELKKIKKPNARSRKLDSLWEKLRKDLVRNEDLVLIAQSKKPKSE
jgi:hypothetical protein